MNFSPAVVGEFETSSGQSGLMQSGRTQIISKHLFKHYDLQIHTVKHLEIFSEDMLGHLEYCTDENSK